MSAIFFLLKAIGIAIADIGIKSYIESNYEQGEKTDILGGKVQIRKVYNKGMAFNFLDDKPELVTKISCYLTTILSIYYLYLLSKKGNFFTKAGFTLFIGGAWSNTFDRWFRGYVVDYIGFNTKWEAFNRLTFNLGDFSILLGADLTTLGEIINTVKTAKEVD